MGLKQSPPGGRGNAGRDHFAYVPTDSKDGWTGYVAGPAQWFECHAKGRTKPCLDAVTGGELVCSRCAQVRPTESIGYLPLYRERDGRPVCVLLHEYTRELVDCLPHHCRVLIGREKGVGNGVWVRKAESQKPPYQSALPRRLRPADVTPSVLVMWGIQELIAWYNQTERPVGGPVSYTPPSERASSAESQPAAPADPPGPRRDADRDALMAIMERRREVPEPSPNGRLKPKG